MLLTETIRSRQLTQPTDLAVSLEEAKSHVNWPLDDSSSDAKIVNLIERATAEFERDTDLCLIRRQYAIQLQQLQPVRFFERPVTALQIQYYDDQDQIQTLAADQYSLDLARNQVKFSRNFLSPILSDRWDASIYTYTVGVATETAGVPQEYKQPVLLLVGYYLENPDMLVSDVAFTKRPYEALVAKLMRSSYP